MKILTVHTYYQQRGGEDISYELEKELLCRNGNDIYMFERSNKVLSGILPLKLGVITIWNKEIYGDFLKFLNRCKPDVVYVTNTFPFLSPAIYYAAFKQRIPVIQSLCNFRLMCLNGFFLRNGKVCEKCKGKLPWYGVIYRCYRNNLLASFTVALMLGIHRRIGTFDLINGYIALTEFSRQKFIEGGLPSNKLFVKPNFLDPDPGVGQDERAGAIFVGRLSIEKGVRVLLEAWERISGSIPLRIVGQGPLAPLVENRLKLLSGVQWLGELDSLRTIQEISRAKFLIFPSIWYEHFPRVFIEAYATGTPIIASKIGASEVLVRDRVTGLHFQAGNAVDLVEKVHWLDGNENLRMQMMANARKEYLENYTGEKNYQIFENILKNVLNRY